MFKSRTHYISHFRRLIDMEREEDIRTHEDEIRKLSGPAREKKGRALLGMRGRRAGRLYGSGALIKFMKPEGQALDEHEIGIGDVIVISQGDPLKSGNPLGTVLDRGRYSVTAVFDGGVPKWLTGRNARLDLYVNDVTYRRMQQALDLLLQGREASPQLMDIVIGDRHRHLPVDRMAPAEEVSGGTGTPLNADQAMAAEKATAAEYLHIVHGPPGTGKTLTGAEILYRASKKFKRILASADSNGAVDNLAQALLAYDLKIVRLGRPFRVSESLRAHVLDEQVASRAEYSEVKRLRDEAFELIKDQADLKHPSPRWTRGMKSSDIHRHARRGAGARGVSASDMKKMSKWLKVKEAADQLFDRAEALESELTQTILREADVILSTNVGAGQPVLEGWTFDLVLIDEATQSTESSALIPAVMGQRLILLGDHKQLPPTVLSRSAAAKGLDRSMLERLVERYGEGPVTMLRTQYRMHEDIMRFPNEAFYNGQLKCGPKNARWSLSRELNDSVLEIGRAQLDLTLSPDVFVHVMGRERPFGDGPSFQNAAEAECLMLCLRALTRAGVDPREIGVISPYKGQVSLIRRLVQEFELPVQVDTVDGFQGQEKAVILMSLVRSNDHGEMGFLNDTRRLNVALTRAKKLRIVVGNETFLGAHPTYRDYIRSAAQKIEV